ncbi:hypothetical protein RJ641_022567 [Dillenia turbinata]|uniref:Uncharacterized protein n=1 Tax=Dillenia turbinata TaxID=194707 RepID=A0AAN8UJK5_9MAGN
MEVEAEKSVLEFRYWTAFKRRFCADSSFFASGNLERELLAKQITTMHDIQHLVWYPTSRLLSIQLSEAHDSFFQAKVARGYAMVARWMSVWPAPERSRHRRTNANKLLIRGRNLQMPWMLESLMALYRLSPSQEPQTPLPLLALGTAVLDDQFTREGSLALRGNEKDNQNSTLQNLDPCQFSNSTFTKLTMLRSCNSGGALQCCTWFFFALSMASPD